MLIPARRPRSLNALDPTIRVYGEDLVALVYHPNGRRGAALGTGAMTPLCWFNHGSIPLSLCIRLAHADLTADASKQYAKATQGVDGAVTVGCDAEEMAIGIDHDDTFDRVIVQRACPLADRSPPVNACTA